MNKLCLLAYSGGLDTSAIIPWIKEKFGHHVIAYCCNVGNLPPQEDLKNQALKLGAHDFIYEDVEEEFANDFINPMVRAGATYFDDYLLGTAIARPLIAKRTAALAKSMKADIIAHGATGKGNDHIRFERAWAYLVPEMAILAPWKIWEFRGRGEIADYLRSKGHSWNEDQQAYSIDLNTFHQSMEGGILENIESVKNFETLQKGENNKRERREDLCEPFPIPFPSLVRSQKQPTIINISIENGFITKLNGQLLNAKEILLKLNDWGTQYNLGLCDIVEERINGLKSHGVYKTPGGTLAHHALKGLKQICWGRDLYFTAQGLAQQYGKLIYDGLWFSDHRLALEAFFQEASQNLTGEISLHLENNRITILSRKGPNSLYRPDIVSFEHDSMDIHQASLGYSKILSITSLLQGLRK